jgi:DNA-damage-inducible protein D
MIRVIEFLEPFIQDTKRRLQVHETKTFADFLPTLTIKAKDFDTEITIHNVVEAIA